MMPSLGDGFTLTWGARSYFGRVEGQGTGGWGSAVHIRLEIRWRFVGGVGSDGSSDSQQSNRRDPSHRMRDLLWTPCLKGCHGNCHLEQPTESIIHLEELGQAHSAYYSLLQMVSDLNRIKDSSCSRAGRSSARSKVPPLSLP